MPTARLWDRSTATWTSVATELTYAERNHLLAALGWNVDNRSPDQPATGYRLIRAIGQSPADPIVVASINDLDTFLIAQSKAELP